MAQTFEHWWEHNASNSDKARFRSGLTPGCDALVTWSNQLGGWNFRTWEDGEIFWDYPDPALVFELGERVCDELAGNAWTTTREEAVV